MAASNPYTKPPSQGQSQTQRPAQPPAAAQPPPPDKLYQGNGFSMGLYDGWQDKTVYTITGPVTEGIQHNILINVDPDVSAVNFQDYVDWNIASLQDQLKACMLLKREQIKLASGIPAYRAIFRWYPREDMRIFQEQIYVLMGKTGYRLTASFTKKTRKTLGPQVERMMLSFNPAPEDKSRPAAR